MLGSRLGICVFVAVILLKVCVVGVDTNCPLENWLNPDPSFRCIDSLPSSEKTKKLDQPGNSRTLSTVAPAKFANRNQPMAININASER